MIRVDRLAKKYCRNLRSTVRYAAGEVLRATLGQTPIPSDLLRRDEFWALQDVDFQLQSGAALGVVGANGSGKSTLLKLLAGILEPDRGSIELHGRVGCLIELGAGFHPQLTGRENIFVNGAILGLGRREMKRRFDDIVAFAGVDDFLDTAVKYYSSGMFVRLGFAVAAHVEPEILLVDEVLSVGDLAFQARCLERMDTLRQGGTTFLFVSHDLAKVSRLCPQTLVLDQGRTAFLGATPEAIDRYRALSYERAGREPEKTHAGPELEILAVEVLDEAGNSRESFAFGSTIRLRVRYLVHRAVDAAVFNFAVFTAADLRQCSGFRSDVDGLDPAPLRVGEGSFDLLLTECPLLPNQYLVSATIWKPGCLAPYAWRWHAGRFTIEGGLELGGVCSLPHRWDPPS
jgi:lipopolysaccharide transport system ATP-binding protein